jgi:hypothetical protein
MFIEPRIPFRGINFARLGIDSWAPQKVYKYMGSGYINWWNMFFGIYSWAPLKV